MLGFGEAEKLDCYKLTAAVMTFGEVRYQQKGRDEQAECPDTQPGTWAWRAAALCGVDPAALLKAFCKPRIKVGTEWVTKGQNVDQATNATGGIARAIYDRLFKWLIEKCNETLIDPEMKKVNFCAVLDIAGFEIFEYNGFEQICINFVNEVTKFSFNGHQINYYHLLFRNSSNSSTTTCSWWSRRPISARGSSGRWWTSVWTSRLASPCLRNQYAIFLHCLRLMMFRPAHIPCCYVRVEFVILFISTHASNI